MTPEQKAIVSNTWLQLSSLNPQTIGAAFYGRLFFIAPHVRVMFPSTLSGQSKKLVAMLHYLVRNIDRPEDVSNAVSALARRHAGYNVKPYHHAVVGNALLWTLEKSPGVLWSEEAEEAWVAYYTSLSKAMIEAHRSAEVAA